MDFAIVDEVYNRGASFDIEEIVDLINKEDWDEVDLEDELFEEGTMTRSISLGSLIDLAPSGKIDDRTAEEATADSIWIAQIEEALMLERLSVVLDEEGSMFVVQIKE